MRTLAPLLVCAFLPLVLSGCGQQSVSPAPAEPVSGEGQAHDLAAGCPAPQTEAERPEPLPVPAGQDHDEATFAQAAANSGGVVSITVDARSVTRRHAHALGFSNGIFYNPKNPGRFDWSPAARLITALKPRIWSVGPSRPDNDQNAFIVDVARLPQTVGTEVALTFADFFPGLGPGIWVGAGCPNDKTCYGSYADLKSDWTAFAESFAAALPTQYPEASYIEVFAEPDRKFYGLTSGQLFELFKIVHDAVRAVVPCIKLSGPALETYGQDKNFGNDAQLLKDFLAYVDRNQLRLDAVNWHEFGPPESIPGHVAEIRDFMSALPNLCTPTCPRIFIMEYAGPTGHLIPGVHLGYLANMEKAGVDRSGLGCWNVPKRDSDGRLTTYSSCWAGFGGMLLDDNRTPQAKYWESAAYVNLPLDRLSVQRLIDGRRRDRWSRRREPGGSAPRGSKPLPDPGRPAGANRRRGRPQQLSVSGPERESASRSHLQAVPEAGRGVLHARRGPAGTGDGLGLSRFGDRRHVDDPLGRVRRRGCI